MVKIDITKNMSAINTGVDNKRVVFNTVAVICSFVLNIGINFFVTPYLVRTLGSAALGFARLATDFASYATLVTLALNSMSSRYLMLAKARGETQKMQEYFSTLVISNCFIAIILLLVFGACVAYIEYIVEIPESLVSQVRIAFAVTFLMFCISLSGSAYGSCFFLTNQLHVSTWFGCVGNILSRSMLVIMLICFQPSIIYIAISGAVSGIYVLCTNLYFFRKLLPEIKLRLVYFRVRRLWELISSGIWNSITKLSQILSSGLDLLVTNFFINPVAMGYLAVAKTIPGIMAGLNTAIASSFVPSLMQHYARGEIQTMKIAAKTSVKFMALFVTLPSAVLLVYGTEFFRLWVPSQPGELINMLSILTLINSCVTGPMQPLYQIFTITNKVRQSSLVIIVYGFLSILVTLICLSVTDLGLYAVAGVSLVGSLIVSLSYHLPFSAIYIGLPWHTFFPEIGKSVLALVTACIVGVGIKLILPEADSWLLWFISVVVMCMLAFAFNICIVLNVEERRSLLQILMRKLHISRK